METETGWLTRRQLAKQLQLSERTIASLTASGAIPSRRVSARAVRYACEEVQIALQNMPSAKREAPAA